MTSSALNSSRSFRLPTALVATGLAAALVGCGGGDSEPAATTEPTTEPEPGRTDPAVAQKEALDAASKKLNAAIAAVPAAAAIGAGQVPTPEQIAAIQTEQIAAIQTAVSELQVTIDSTPDVSEYDKIKYKNLVNTVNTQLIVALTPTEDPGMEQKQNIVALYQKAKELVDDLTPESKQEEVDIAQKAITDLKNYVLESTDISDKDLVEEYNNSAVALQRKLDATNKGIANATDNKKIIEAIKDYTLSEDMTKIPSGMSIEYETDGELDLSGSRISSIRSIKSSDIPDKEFSGKTFKRINNNEEVIGMGKVFTSNGGMTPEQKEAYPTWAKLWGKDLWKPNSKPNTPWGIYATIEYNTATSGSDVFTNFGRVKFLGGAEITSTSTTPSKFPSSHIKIDNVAISEDRPTNNDNIVSGSTYPGELFGVEGTFKGVDASDITTNAGLKVYKNADGYLIISGGNLLFTPDADVSDLDKATTFQKTTIDKVELVIKQEMPDNSYVTFGYWGNKDKTVIDTFADGDADYDELLEDTTTKMSDIKGDATYKGVAAGIYVVKGTDDDKSYSNGDFTAAAELTAYFGKSWSIDGTIKGFEADNGKDNLSSWELELEEASISSKNLDGFGDDTSGGGDKGEWQAAFYGIDAKDDNKPVAVVGEFTGHFSNGHAVGAFGAEKD